MRPYLIIRLAIITVRTIIFAAGTGQWLLAAGAGSSGNYTFTLDPSPYAGSLNGSLTAGADHLSAHAYNPASLSLLKGGHLLFDRQSAYGTTLSRFSTGRSFSKRRFGWAMSVGHYDAGTVAIYREDGSYNLINAQRDLYLTTSLGFRVGKVHAGITGKYLSTKLAQKFEDRVFAGDIGLIVPIGRRIRLGTSAQNLGTGVTYVNVSAPLPRLLRAGLAVEIFKKLPTTLSIDTVRYINEEENIPSAGLETKLGPFSIRGGILRQAEELNYSFGAGLNLGMFSLDYSMGLIGQLDPQQRMSFGIRFGGAKQPTVIVQKQDPIAEAEARELERRKAALHGEEIDKETITFIDRDPNIRPKSSVYEVQPGDTLAIIAQKMYGDSRLWNRIYLANQHLINDFQNLTTGRKLIIP